MSKAIANHLEASQTAQYLDDICASQIIVIGDLMLDRFIDGKVLRISPEAPVPVLSQTRMTSMPGGAANVARNICQLGAQSILIGVVGADEAGRALGTALSDIAGLTYCPVTINERPTTSKTRFRAGMQQIMRHDEEITEPITQKTAEKLHDMVAAHISQAAMVILSDYAKGCLTKPLINRLIALAKSHDKPVIVDPKSDDFSRYEGAFLLTPNLSELAKASTSQALDDKTDDATIAKAANKLCDTHHISHILTTLSARGMRLDGNGLASHVPSLTKDVFDVSGAGDTVVAALSCAYSAGASLEEAMIFANQAAGIVVSKAGTAVCCAGELIASSGTNYDIKTKLSDYQDLIASWRKDGLKIGFTNGCFDLLHPGHIHVLRQAAQQCDKLIIAVNSDSSVKALKGPKRPVQPQEMRAFVLANLPACDAVILFEDETPISLIQEISPDVLIKGGDYNVADIVGSQHVIQKGGEVLTIPLLEGHSTTAFVTKS